MKKLVCTCHRFKKKNKTGKFKAWWSIHLIYKFERRILRNQRHEKKGRKEERVQGRKENSNVTETST